MAMNPSQARVIDPILTTVARGFQNAAYVGMSLFPSVQVQQRGGNIIQFDKKHFKRYNTRRAPGGNVADVEFGYAGRPYALNQHALNGKVPIELLQEANAVPGINMASQAVYSVLEITRLELECQQAALALNASNYPTGNKLTLSGTSQWSHVDSKPAKAVRDASEVVRGKIGKRPNLLLLGGSVFSSLQENPSIIERLKYTGRDSVTKEMLAQLFGVERVEVGDAVYANDNDEFVDVWGKHAVLAYVNVSSLASMGTPSFAYTYQLAGHPLVEEAYFDKDTKSWKYPVTDEHSPEIVGADAGFLFTNASA